MKKIFILRHAQTFSSSGDGDRERKLTPRGMEDALNLGAAMKQKNYMPDFVFCSPVTRTRQTLDQVLESLGKIPAEFPKVIYEGGHPELMDLLNSADDRYQAVMMVGHNPSIHQFAASLAHESNEGLMDKLAAGYPPGTLTVLEAPRASWADVQMGGNKLMDIIEAA